MSETSETRIALVAILIVVLIFTVVCMLVLPGATTCVNTVLIVEHGNDEEQSLSCPRADQTMTLDSEQGFWTGGKRYTVTCTCPVSPSSEL